MLILFGTALMVSAMASRMSSKYGFRRALPESNIGRFSESMIWIRKPSGVISNRIWSLNFCSCGFSSTLFCNSCSNNSSRSCSTCSAMPSTCSVSMVTLSGCGWDLTSGLRVLSGASSGEPPRSIM
ncbi:hypothetical protein D3C78_1287030 [compost metagenome]